MATYEGIVNGSNVLVTIGGVALDYCTNSTFSLSGETKESAVKPLQSVTDLSAGLWTSKSLNKLSASITGEGINRYSETNREYAYEAMQKAMVAGKPVECALFNRGDTTNPYAKGKFIITSLQRTDPVAEDSTYSITLENAGKVEVMDESSITTTQS